MPETIDSTATEVPKQQLTIVPAYNQTAQDLAQLEHECKNLVVDTETPAGMKAAKAIVQKLVKCRTTLERVRKEANADLIRAKGENDDEAKRIASRIVALEEPIRLQVERKEAEEAAAQAARDEAARLRVQKLTTAIQEIRDTPASVQGQASNIINGALVRVRSTILVEAEFAEYWQQAVDARDAVIGRLTTMLHDQKAHEAEQAQLLADREELERQREANARLQREADERAEADRLERERVAQAAREAERAEQDRLAAVRQKLMNKIAAIGKPFFQKSGVTKAQCIDLLEQARELVLTEGEFGDLLPAAEAARDSAVEQIHDAMQVLEQIERERAERAEQEAALQAERERQAAEQARLDAEQAKLKRERQEAAAEAERVRLAGLDLREAAEAVVSARSNGGNVDAAIDDLAAALANEAAPVKPAKRSKKVKA